MCKRTRDTGFSLIELLVVLAIIGILATLLLPTLSRAQSKAKAIGCINNLKQLQVCTALYAADFFDTLPPNNSLASLTSGEPISDGVSWCTNYARYDVEPDGIRNGVLFRYNSSLQIYRCPADQSVTETRSGEKLTVRRWRSYNLSQSINGAPLWDSWVASYIPSFQKLSQVQAPGPTECLTFIEVHEDSIYDALFGIPTKAYGGDSRMWWDIPANRHGDAAVMGFADGHAEAWRWKTPKKVHQRLAAQYVPDHELDDYKRVQRGVRQTWD